MSFAEASKHSFGASVLEPANQNSFRKTSVVENKSIFESNGPPTLVNQDLKNQTFDGNFQSLLSPK